MFFISPTVKYIRGPRWQNESDESKIWKIALVLSARTESRHMLSAIARNMNTVMNTEVLRELCHMTIMMRVFATKQIPEMLRAPIVEV